MCFAARVVGLKHTGMKRNAPVEGSMMVGGADIPFCLPLPAAPVAAIGLESQGRQERLPHRPPGARSAPTVIPKRTRQRTVYAPKERGSAATGATRGEDRTYACPGGPQEATIADRCAPSATRHPAFPLPASGQHHAHCAPRVAPAATNLRPSGAKPALSRLLSFAMTIVALTGALLTIGCSSKKSGYAVANTFEATFPRAAVAADHAIASAAGAEILAKGGNAVDAAVATSFTLSVVRPMSCGMGGGGFMVIKFHDDPKHGNLATALNYRETTPGAVHPDFYEKDADKEASTVGGKACGIPGSVHGLLYALEKYGTLDRATVMAPAIRAAREGFVVDQYYIDGAKARIKWFNENQSRKSRFAFVWKRFLREGNVKIGDRITLREQANALELIARDGADAFYKGPIALAIVKTIEQDGGVMTMDDLAGYTLREVAPLKYTAFGRAALTMPPPSSGGIAIGQVAQLLNSRGALTFPPFVGRDEVARKRSEWFDTADGRHTFVEAAKHAFADRARHLADPAFSPVPVAEMLDKHYLRQLSIEPTTRPTAAYGGNPAALTSPRPDDHGTSHFSVIDARGNAVACTETINLEFGSKLAVAEYGFCLNNEMDDFTTRRGQANAFKLVQSDRNLPEPGKRPLSSMTPTIVLDDKGDVLIIAGASGGPRIITGTLQAILNVLLKDNTAGEAVAAPRIHHQWQPDILYAEKGALTPEAAEELKKKGHVIEPTGVVGNVQLIRRSKTGKGWNAACDPRKGGRPAGF